jgi:hypothetical protein
VTQFVVLALLAAGLSGVQTVPAVRFWLSATPGGVARHDWTLEESSRAVIDKAPMDDRIAAALEPLRGHRTITSCTTLVDESDLLEQRIPSIGGFGGAYLADYARFVNIASGEHPEKPTVYAGIDGAGRAPARPDLLGLLAVEYLIDCRDADPEHWEPVARVGRLRIYRNRSDRARAVWTCAAQPIGREELEFRLRQSRYDEALNLRGGGPVIHVRWAPDVDDARRAAAEAQFRILRGRFLGERTWEYQLFDSSLGMVQTIVTSPLVEDTSGVDRSTFVVVSRDPDFSAEPKTEWLTGLASCGQAGEVSVAVADRADGVVVADVAAPADGIVLFAEPFYPLRSARVDGVAVDTRKVNLAFTGVPVPAGRHRIELRYDPQGVRAGWIVSAAALMFWAATAWRRLPHRA